MTRPSTSSTRRATTRNRTPRAPSCRPTCTETWTSRLPSTSRSTKMRNSSRSAATRTTKSRSSTSSQETSRSVRTSSSIDPWDWRSRTTSSRWPTTAATTFWCSQATWSTAANSSTWSAPATSTGTPSSTTSKSGRLARTRERCWWTSSKTSPKRESDGEEAPGTIKSLKTKMPTKLRTNSSLTSTWTSVLRTIKGREMAATTSTKRKIIPLDISTKINHQMMSKERTAKKHLQGRDLTPVKMKKNPKNQEAMQPIRKQLLVSMKTAQRKEIPTTT